MLGPAYTQFFLQIIQWVSENLVERAQLFQAIKIFMEISIYEVILTRKDICFVVINKWIINSAVLIERILRVPLSGIFYWFCSDRQLDDDTKT